jgi:hypothetical protein
MSFTVLVVVALAAGVPAPAAAQDPALFAAGDIACDPDDPSFNGGLGTATACRQQATADRITAGGADAVIALGDLQYDSASLSNLQRSYALSWGVPAIKSITRPLIGNHEGTSASSGSGYCSYFGAAAHCNSSGQQGGAAFYSFDLGAWHVVVLNSNCTAAGGCEAGSAQYQWLAADLAANPATCTLAAWHHPRWSSGHDGNSVFMQPIWELLHARGADLVLAGHSHHYERFAPINGAGAVDANGMRSFIVGTGGAFFTGASGAEPGSQRRQNDTFGVLRLDLHPESYGWAFVAEAGRTFTDAGSQSCRGAGAPADTQAPTVPGALSAAATSPTRIDLAWSAASDNVGVTGYEIRRALGTGTPGAFATVADTTLRFADTSVQAGRTYAYDVRARDAAGNLSSASNRVTVSTPPASAPTVPGPQAGAAVSLPARVGVPAPLPLVVASDRAPPPVATILRGVRRVTRAGARRSGLVVRFITPQEARRATISLYRTRSGRRTLVARRRVAVRDGVNRISLDSRAVRRRLRPSLYLITVTLRADDGRVGARASALVRVVRSPAARRDAQGAKR